ncbi:hypothetical protein JYG23_06270 [Sedimentibacter sp. zth1]|uniref:hypothetical protein n=1 Tax=Sedimentibacter sp. zth1 TaxID=2816908 RepID=UPI001A917E62|nr:hypothetical protein [Sedimentibacter sp. zth1]QSX06990.1 hypothetical protein JYG23_06270 [Sedimentibacter sp. zth1]
MQNIIKNEMENIMINDDTHEILNDYHDEDKEPSVIAKSMSWMKTNISCSLHESDSTVADLITDGCNMGVKSLNKYLNKYKAAEEKVKNIAKKLCSIEEKLSIDIRQYL